jgi:phosphomevalonate kinase
MAGLREAAAALTGAIERADTRAAIDACDAHAHAMAALGMAADAPIVTPALRRASRLAAEHGGAAKPSGAGGGDVALAFFERDEDAVRFGEACPEAGLTLLPIALGDVGVRVEH